MPDEYVQLGDVRWVDYLLGGYAIKAPHFLAERHPRPSWERERFQSMEQHLRPGMILMDIGAEQGQQSVIYARFVGGDSMVLMEPSPDVWPNIYCTWQVNGLRDPLACWCGFVSNHTDTAPCRDYDNTYDAPWPGCCYGGRLLDSTKFRYDSPDQQRSSTDSITLDDFCAWRQIRPAALTMDVEGYEIRVLQGAIETIKACSPLVWTSLHTGDNNILKRCEGGDPVGDVHRLMLNLGYRGVHISTDHEEHWYWSNNGAA